MKKDVYVVSLHYGPLPGYKELICILDDYDFVDRFIGRIKKDSDKVYSDVIRDDRRSVRVNRNNRNETIIIEKSTMILRDHIWCYENEEG